VMERDEKERDVNMVIDHRKRSLERKCDQKSVTYRVLLV
jgi:hypothetical protein